MERVRELMNESGVWRAVMNLQIYTIEEFISEFDELLNDELKTLLKENVSKIQKYCDEQIIVPKNGE